VTDAFTPNAYHTISCSVLVKWFATSCMLVIGRQHDIHGCVGRILFRHSQNYEMRL